MVGAISKSNGLIIAQKSSPFAICILFANAGTGGFISDRCQIRCRTDSSQLMLTLRFYESPSISTSPQSNRHSALPPPSLTSRGFLPWRLSDDGPRYQPNRRDGPSSETLHNRRHSPSNILVVLIGQLATGAAVRSMPCDRSATPRNARNLRRAGCAPPLPESAPMLGS